MTRAPSRSLPGVRALLGALVLALATLAWLWSPGGAQAGARRPVRAHAAAHYVIGVGDEQAEMFTDPLWMQLHTKIVRYIAPYDAVAHRDSLANATAWIHSAEAAHQQVLVAFYHSEHTPTVLPSVAQYRRDVAAFVKLFPRVHQYQSWDEANRGYISGVLASPSASAAAGYYQALLRSCHGCNVVGLDVLDGYDIGPTLNYIYEFKRAIGRLRTVMPSTWGLHNYSDVNRFETWRTRELASALGGQIWLTETGGIVKFGGAFPNVRGSGLSRAARALKQMFKIAKEDPSVKRLYIYDWSGGKSSTRFDAGLTDYFHHPRESYVVVCKALHAGACGVHTSSR